MGKNMIIKGADFSANSIVPETTWFVDEYDQLIDQGGSITATANPRYAGFAPNYDFGGKSINIIKGYAKQAGKVSLWVGNTNTDSAAIKVAEIEILSTDINTVVTKSFNTIVVPNGKKLWIGNVNDGGAFGYNNSTSHPSSFGAFYLFLGTSSARSNTSPRENLALNWGYTGIVE